MDQNLLSTIILGAVQGVTEFLPISSSGHLIVVPELLGLRQNNLVFDVVLHLGTALAISIYFFSDLSRIFLSFLKDLLHKRNEFKDYSQDASLGLKIIIGSVPAVIMGVLFEEAFESTFRSTVFVAMFLIIGSLLMTLAEIFIRKKDKGSEIAEKDKAEDPEAVYGISYLNSFVVGIFQSFALFPGISRSGSTISAGIFSGLNRESAARFSFLLSVPIILAAAVYKISISYTELMLLDLTTVIAGFFSSFILGLISIKFLLKYLKNNKLHFFIVYRILMAGVLLAFFI